MQLQLPHSPLWPPHEAEDLGYLHRYLLQRSLRHPLGHFVCPFCLISKKDTSLWAFWEGCYPSPPAACHLPALVGLESFIKGSNSYRLVAWGTSPHLAGDLAKTLSSPAKCCMVAWALPSASAHQLWLPISGLSQLRAYPCSFSISNRFRQNQFNSCNSKDTDGGMESRCLSALRIRKWRQPDHQMSFKHEQRPPWVAKASCSRYCSISGLTQSYLGCWRF